MLSTLMWPQPPVFLSTIWIWACWPCQLGDVPGDPVQRLVVLAGGGGTTWPSTIRLTAVGGSVAEPAVYGWLPPPTSRSM